MAECHAERKKRVFLVLPFLLHEISDRDTDREDGQTDMETGRTARIVIVDGDGNRCESLKRAVVGAGYTVASADDPEKALHLLVHDPADLLFVDAVFFDGDADDFSGTVRSRYPETAIVILADTMDGVDPSEAFSRGFDDVRLRAGVESDLAFYIPLTIERRRLQVESGVRIDELEARAERNEQEFRATRQELDQNYIDTIKTFIGLLETRFKYLGGHCKRVATFCRTISEKYDVNDRVKSEIEIGALLHDIGKIALPDALVQKARDYFMVSQLSKREHDIIKRHPVIGQEAVEMIEMLKHAGVYIRHHHEQFDGGGYPDGLEGGYIPLGARIIAVVDAFDRIVTSVEKARRKNAESTFLKFVRKHRGQLFDPEATDYLLQLIWDLKSREYSRERRVDITSLAPGMVLSRDVFTKSGVLLISQYERLTPKDITRLEVFHHSGLVMGFVYIYSSREQVRAAKKDVRPVEKKPEKPSVILSFREVCAAIDGTRDFKTLPSSYRIVTDMLGDPKSTRDDIARILKRDIVIVTKLLRIVNSPLFGFDRSIATIEDAIPLLGFNEIRSIVASLSVLETAGDGKEGDDLFDRPAFWRHSIACAIVSRIIAQKVGIQHPEELFTAGLMHDIGKLVLDQLFPDEFRRVLSMVRNESVFLRQAERQVFGGAHQSAGEYLLEKWGMPEMLIDTVKNHHAPMDSTVDPVAVSAVHVADILVHMLDVGKSGEPTVPRLDSYAERKLGITLSDIELLVPEIDEKIKESDELLQPGN